MTRDSRPTDQDLDQLLSELAAAERRHRAPAGLQQRLVAQVGAEGAANLGAVGTAHWSTLLDQLLLWLRQHRLRASLLSATAAALPLALGLLLAIETRPATDITRLETDLDPTASWLLDLEALGEPLPLEEPAP